MVTHSIEPHQHNQSSVKIIMIRKRPVFLISGRLGITLRHQHSLAQLIRKMAKDGQFDMAEVPKNLIKSTPRPFILKLLLTVLLTLPYKANGAVVYSCTGQDGTKQYSDRRSKLIGCADQINKTLSQEEPAASGASRSQNQGAVAAGTIGADADHTIEFGTKVARSNWSSVNMPFTILHVGDSHVRKTSLAASARNALKQAKPGGGLTYISFGINGSTYASISKIPHFFENQEFPQHPDLLILDWGTNDIAKSNRIPVDHSKVVSNMIQRARKAYPQAIIMLTSTQDMSYRGHQVTASSEYSVLMRQIAQQTGCLFFDWHHISGGANSMRLWVQSGLAQADYIHLTPKGYQRKGIMLAKAIEEAFVKENTASP